MFRSKGGNSFILNLLSRQADSVPDREDSRVEKTDNTARISFLYYFTILRHHLLRLRQADLLILLYMHHFHTRFKLSGTDTHKSDPVPVRSVHIGLNLEDKARESFLHRINDSCIRFPRERGCSHFQEMFQEDLHAKIGQSRAKEHRRQFSFVHQALIKFCAGAVQKVDLLQKRLLLALQQHTVCFFYG